MKKNFLSEKSANILATIYFFLAAIYSLNYLPNSISAHALGIVLLIASVYGVVAVSTNSEFLFK